MKKRGTILIENIVFILLTLIFLSSLIIFVSKQSSSAHVLEPIYAKKIALLIDASRPGEIIRLNMNNAKKISDKEGVNFKNIFLIKNNVVYVKLSKKTQSSYSFFNDVKVNEYPDTNSGKDFNGNYIFVISKRDK